MQFMEKVVTFIEKLNGKIGYIVSLICTLMVLTVFYDTIMRYAFNKGSVALQELEWHLFAVVFLIGAAYTFREDGHVRVDILYMSFSDKTKAWIDFCGTFIFLIPFAIMVILSSKTFIINSWHVREVSPDPGGLPARYLLKAMIPLGFSLLIIQGIAEALKNFMVIVGYKKKKEKK